MITIKITGAAAALKNEPFSAPFGFKGVYIDGCPQTAVRLCSEGTTAIGAANQSVVWADAALTARIGYNEANNLMFSITQYAVSQLCGFGFSDPAEVYDFLLPLCERYICETLNTNDPYPVFIRNALQPVDLAAYILYAKCTGIRSFPGLIPDCARAALGFGCGALARIPLISYSEDGNAIRKTAADAAALIKIKLGFDPSGNNDPQSILKWDKERLTQIYDLTRDTGTAYTENGHIMYYIDCNGCYPEPGCLYELLGHADRTGMLHYICILEEPFPERSDYDVSGFPVRIAADESAHSLSAALARIDSGYRAIALKPIAKTLTESFRIVSAAYERSVPCFCADLTVNPFVLEWNKHFAAGLLPLPSLKTGILESNGMQNYARWDLMEKMRVSDGGRPSDCTGGIFGTGGSFSDDGSLFYDYGYYTDMFDD